jgi:hypothetical protein
LYWNVSHLYTTTLTTGIIVNLGKSFVAFDFLDIALLVFLLVRVSRFDGVSHFTLHAPKLSAFCPQNRELGGRSKKESQAASGRGWQRWYGSKN